MISAGLLYYVLYRLGFVTRRGHPGPGERGLEDRRFERLRRRRIEPDTNAYPAVVISEEAGSSGLATPSTGGGKVASGLVRRLVRPGD